MRKIEKDSLEENLLILALWMFAVCLATASYVAITADPSFFKGPEPEPKPLLGWVLACLSAAFAIKALMIIFEEPLQWLCRKLNRGENP